ncbi:uncharacterized protein K452DRAFT_302879 [Aplosporella prunicola CBS 121167]|uniref:Uncharacterized protein n=1 Tax=Aplosporella prunicola CBS 121167 TaxID=1176127 RepID=A0A6A6AZT6_9PEZI|nr:uncharacterized protein K452DRAFT_302879 [Aplosporella prunicola CBS 121167]KAF2136287.1 hypothetical protein K452DRAFT_302879 [Aplosporella prunicola CBS 121167]
MFQAALTRSLSFFTTRFSEPPPESRTDTNANAATPSRSKTPDLRLAEEGGISGTAPRALNPAAMQDVNLKYSVTDAGSGSSRAPLRLQSRFSSSSSERTTSPKPQDKTSTAAGSSLQAVSWPRVPVAVARSNTFAAFRASTAARAPRAAGTTQRRPAPNPMSNTDSLESLSMLGSCGELGGPRPKHADTAVPEDLSHRIRVNSGPTPLICVRPMHITKVNSAAILRGWEEQVESGRVQFDSGSVSDDESVSDFDSDP